MTQEQLLASCACHDLERFIRSERVTRAGLPRFKRVKRRKRRPLVGDSTRRGGGSTCDTVKLREVPKAVATKPVSKESRWPG